VSIDTRGGVYVIHIDPPYSHARHYIGYADRSVRQRIDRHIAGQGATLTRTAVRAGHTLHLVRVWLGADRHFERRKKNNRGAKHCPVCCGRSRLGDPVEVSDAGGSLESPEQF
jgi:hypothetical protein